MSSDRRFRRAVGRVLIALSFKNSRHHGATGDAHRPRSLGFECHRPGGYPPSPILATDRRSASTPPYCTVVLPSPTGFAVRTFYYFFYRMTRMHNAYCVVAGCLPSARPSAVRPSDADIVSIRPNTASNLFHRRLATPF